MGLNSRKENKGRNYRLWRMAIKADANPVISRQETRQVIRKERIRFINAQFGGESRKTRRILALDSIRKHKKGVKS